MPKKKRRTNYPQPEPNPLQRTNVPCPSCTRSLIAFTDAGVVYGGCSECGGMWLANAASQALWDGKISEPARDFIRAISSRAKTMASVGSGYRDAAANPRTCPVCAKQLVEKRVPQLPVTVDVCAAHGTYFDHGETGFVWTERSIANALDEAEAEAAAEAARRLQAMSAGIDIIISVPD